MWFVFCFLCVLSLLAQAFFIPVTCWADWTPLVTSGMFTGISTDVTTAVGGIIGIALIILGAALLMRALRG
jgi:hypothetical protein